MSFQWPQGVVLSFFSPTEFDHPELMDTTFLRDLDALRLRCGFGLQVKDDARTKEEQDALYPGQQKDSAHLYTQGGPFIRAVDIKPSPPYVGDPCTLSLEERQLTLTYEILRLWREGRWPHLGLGLETAHWHVDDTPRLPQRPSFWVDVSK